MGNTEQQISQLRLNQSDWLLTKKTGYLRNKTSDQVCYLIEKQKIQGTEIQTYKYRHQNCVYLPDIRGVIIRSNNHPSDKHQSIFKCTHENSFFTILFEPIIYRFPDLGAVSLKNGLYILKQSLQALSLLYERYGVFQFYEDMIGFNRDGQCKVWMNSNFYSSVKQETLAEASTIQKSKHKNKQKQLNKDTKQLNKMMNYIFELIEDRIQYSSEFQRYNNQKNEALLFLNEGLNRDNSQGKNIETVLLFINNKLTEYDIDNLTYRIDLPEIIDIDNEYQFLDQLQITNPLNNSQKTKLNSETASTVSKLSLKPYNYCSQRRLNLPKKQIIRSYKNKRQLSQKNIKALNVQGYHTNQKPMRPNTRNLVNQGRICNIKNIETKNNNPQIIHYMSPLKFQRISSPQISQHSGTVINFRYEYGK